MKVPRLPGTVKPAAGDDAVALEGFVVRSHPLLRKAGHNRSLIAGATIIGILVLMAILAPWIERYDPLEQNLQQVLALPSWEHWLGTDQLGRDVWSRLIWAGRFDLATGFLVVLVPIVVGTIIGTLAGYYRGWLDTVLSRIIDVVMAFPYYVLVITLVFAVGKGVRGIFIAFALTDWVTYARTVRSTTLVTRGLGWSAAAKGGGLSDARILGRHILPNTITQVIVYAMSDIVYVILAVVTLGYLGLGIQAPQPDWGSMIFDGQAFMTTRWWISTIPGLMVVVTGIGLSLLGDGLADVLRPE
jgi:peptide/nickel transport system permease protein